jgi:5-methylthioribose kinase
VTIPVLYQLEQKIDKAELKQLVKFEWFYKFQKTVIDDELNETMRKLNYEHIFEYPFKMENGFDLDGIQLGLQASAMPLQNKSTIER